MKQDFPALWAESPGTLRREPTNTELAGGFPCGSLDLYLFNELFYRLSQAQREILTAIIQSGQAPSANNTGQLWEAIKSVAPSASIWHRGTDNSSTATALTATVAPAVPSYIALTAYSIRAANNSADGGTTANFGPGSRQVVRADGGAIRRGDWFAGQVIVLLDDGDRLQLVRSAADTPPASLWHTGAAGGTTSAVTSTVSPAISVYEDRLPIFLTFPNGIADGATAALNGLPAIPMQRNDGTPIQRADIPPGSGQLFNVSGTGALRLAGLGRGEVQRIVLNPTLYVRPDGNDANDGLSNTSAGAFATIAAAVAKGTGQFNFASSALNIQLGAPGTYAAPGTLPRGTGTINIIGNAANQSGYLISGAAAPGFGVVQTSGPLVLTGVTVQNTGTGSHTVATTGAGSATLFNTTLWSTQTTSGSHLFAVDSSGITLATGCVIQGNAQAAFSAIGGFITVNPSTNVTLNAGPTFSLATAVALNGGKITLLSGASVSGAANGQRYNVQNYSIIATNGGGENAFPGSTAGYISNGLYL